LGQDLEVTIQGTGFTENTRVLFYPDSGNRLQILGSADITHEAISVAVDCNTAYITSLSADEEEFYLQIVDATSSTGPVLKSTRTLPSLGKAIAGQGGMAYVLTEQHGLFIYDVTDPSQPDNIGQVAIPYVQPPYYVFAFNYGISLVGSYAYVAYGTSGLYVINVSDPRHPAIVGHAPTSGYASGISISGTWAYVSVCEFGLKVFDVSNPAAPQLRGSLPFFGEILLVLDVDVVDHTAYVLDAGSLGGLKVIDVSDPQHPALIRSLLRPSLVLRITVSGNRAYIATPDFGLLVLDIRARTAPVLLGSISVPGFASDVAIANGLAYVAAEDLEVIDIADITGSTIISSVPTMLAEGITVDNATAYVAAMEGLQLYDISNPSQPELLAAVPSDFGFPQDVVVLDNIAYVAEDYFGLRLIDISDPENPDVIAGIDIDYFSCSADWPPEISAGSNAWDVAIVDKIAYMATNECGLQIIDVDPLSPTYLDILASYQTYTDFPAARGIAVVGSTAYLADYETGLWVIDVSDPENPSSLSTYNYPASVGTNGVAVGGNIAYLAVETGGLQLVDISNSLSPSPLGGLGSPDLTGYDVTLVGQTAYLASLWQGVHIIDVADPNTPIVLASIPTLSYATDVRVAADLAVVADNFAGFCILEAPREIASVPDPVTPESKMTATLPANFKGDYTIRVLDTSGSDELAGAVTFLAELPSSKAVIVAGYGPHSTNKVWEETLLNANYAWSVLFDQGYLQENIRYLSPVVVDVNNDGTPDVNGDATLAGLEAALTTWAADADDLILYLVGHGGNESFVMKHNGTVHEELQAGVLAGWLNTLQTATGKRAVTVYEACYSGSFLDEMQLAAGATFERMLMTSSTSNQVSILGNNGRTSFSHRFWESVLEQGELVAAFQEASEMMAGFGQVPWLDGNCDGLPNTPADSSQETIVGRGYTFQSPLKPVISCATPDQNLRDSDSATLWAKTVSSNPISRVWAEIIPPNYDPLDPEAAELPTVELAWSSSGRRYEGTYSQLDDRGTYHVAFYAMDNQQIVSLPRIGRITIPSFSWNLFMPAITGEKNGAANN